VLCFPFIFGGHWTYGPQRPYNDEMKIACIDGNCAASPRHQRRPRGGSAYQGRAADNRAHYLIPKPL